MGYAEPAPPPTTKAVTLPLKIILLSQKGSASLPLRSPPTIKPFVRSCVQSFHP